MTKEIKSNNIVVVCPYCKKESDVEIGGVNEFYESIVKCKNKMCEREFVL